MTSPDALTSPVMLGDDAQSHALAHRLGLTLASTPDSDDLWLHYGEQGLVLGGDKRQFGAPIQADLVGGGVAHRRQFGGGRGQLIARACGLKQGVSPDIIDATAGLGRDSAVLASLGSRVLMIERHPVVAALLFDALERARRQEDLKTLTQRLFFVEGDSSQTLSALVAASSVAPQVIHLDPMYPHQDKSALVKKEMRLFRRLVGDDMDAPQLLAQALDLATHRVVVKRPKGAPPIEGPSPSHEIVSKNSRYDLYVHRSLKPSR
ncbi:class I SAM-dependent methyltransferase [Kushneria marisflavi]|uniref:Ribosomal RNA small subunit methyltransferase J n=1 Tax=Kushneria marisflavi TaxID=157779 RepID=A0A240UME6_9GAMM|nr:class I SAM-dependent methyltransferase [Kushneria marisflavi]ART62212.1 rRNA methyltransferase [Kushneria marisflavi]RKD87297.1 16S rRNA (guanine1516-N2)-methyltransferase [Kushneria marisflavi]